MGNAVLKTYFSYHEMIMDFASLSPALDAGKTLSVGNADVDVKGTFVCVVVI